jgi:hypothetical protein
MGAEPHDPDLEPPAWFSYDPPRANELPGGNEVDFEIGRFTRRCAATDREFRPGDTFYSVLIPAGATVIRKDYSADHWPGAAEESICWWKSEMPDTSAHKVTWAPNDAILGYFTELIEKPTRADQLYVLALLMIRKRIVRLEESQRNEAGDEEMLLYCPGNEQEYRVAVVEPDAQRIEQIQTELAQLLFSAVK